MISILSISVLLTFNFNETLQPQTSTYSSCIQVVNRHTLSLCKESRSHSSSASMKTVILSCSVLFQHEFMADVENWSYLNKFFVKILSLQRGKPKKGYHEWLKRGILMIYHCGSSFLLETCRLHWRAISHKPTCVHLQSTLKWQEIVLLPLYIYKLLQAFRFEMTCILFF